MRIRFRGVKRDGAGSIGGAITDDVATWVEIEHRRRRWYWLEVTNEAGEVVGAIDVDEDTGRRVWWGEDCSGWGTT